MVSTMSYPPSHDELVQKALNYLKEIHPQDYYGMSTQRRDKYAEEAANRAEGCAETLIAQGKSESEAWNTAIRQEILGTESG
jgi:hypothetical protein